MYPSWLDDHMIPSQAALNLIELLAVILRKKRIPQNLTKSIG